jgi:dimethylhistidine N-methyltransferase
MHMPGLVDAKALDTLRKPAADEFRADMQRALSALPRSISPKYFYDEAGSLLFDQICKLPEYYPTRTELSILTQYAPAMAELIGPQAEVVEFGAGSLQKIRLLLDALERPCGYLPVDISASHLTVSAAALALDYPNLKIHPVVADYTQPFELPPFNETSQKRVGFFPGSTLGNFSPVEALHFLSRLAHMLQGGGLLLGVDLIKNPDHLHAAYNDRQGITAAFNLNLLVRANRELGCNFQVQHFDHSAFYNPPQRRIEMHLVSQCAQSVVLAGQTYHLAQGDSLHTENSYKFTPTSLGHLALEAGFTPGPLWTDAERLFCVQWLQAPNK